MQTVVTGATGFIGTKLVKALLAGGHTVSVLSRGTEETQEKLGPNVTVYDWDDTATWHGVVAGADTVFHLAGASVAAERWTPEYKAKILSSRVDTTREIVNAKPRTLICASASGYYGDRGSDIVTEETPAGDDFLAKVCIAWEAEAHKAEEHGARVVCLRTGIGLGRDGGALKSILEPPVVPFSPWKIGLGGPLGSGDQWMPWVHVRDVVRLYLFAAETANLSGPVNATAPKPVRNKEFSLALGQAMNRPALVPVPGLALRAMVGEFAESLLYSQRIYPRVAESHGFTFEYPEIGPALQEIMQSE